ncbi:MAG: hypothetical protein DRP12_01600 [Candidatus Aenigmatarchaeota archaeon]|nr:MAG: hypothetical protein DRP12_01600 [Candidatus Aenigmarchaeota archaeon]
MISEIRVKPVFCSSKSQSIQVEIKAGRQRWTASVPVGTSRGEKEAKVKAFREIQRVLPKVKKAVKGKRWPEVDRELERLLPEIGGNLALGISLASARARFSGELWKIGKPKAFPHPLINLVGGGAHGGGTDWQEFLIIPKGKDLLEEIGLGIEIWTAVGDELRKKGILLGQNLEGAWMAKLNDLKTLDFLAEIAEDWGVRLGIDCAASQLWNGQKYSYRHVWRLFDRESHLDFLAEVVRKYRIFYLEDPGITPEELWELRRACRKTLIVGDDVYCTNPELLKEGIKKRGGNGVIIKPNQVGTLSLAGKAVELARKAGWEPVPSHRSQETEDYWISDLALGWQARLIKIGMNDMPKFNRLLSLWYDFKNPKLANL